MLISTDIGAGEIVAPGEETRFYDDIQCLAADWTSHRGGGTAFVRLATGTWSDAPTAFYARPHSLRTAMGSGIAVYTTAAEARAADGSGEALTFDEVMKLTRTQP